MSDSKNEHVVEQLAVGGVGRGGLEVARPDDLWLELPDELVESIMDEYKYGLRFRMCMRELNKISQWVEYKEGSPGAEVPIQMWGTSRTWSHVKGPGFAFRMGSRLFRLIAPYGGRGWRKPYDHPDSQPSGVWD